MLQLVVDDVLHLLPNPLHLGPVEDAAGQGDEGQHHQGDHQAKEHQQDVVSPLLRVNDSLLEDTNKVWSQFINALLHPEYGDHGGVDLTEVSEDLQLGHHHVDLEPGLGAQSGPCHLLDIKPEPVLLLQQ